MFCPNSLRLLFFIALEALVAMTAHAANTPRKIVLIAGPITGHPKEAHEYEKNVILLKHLLDTSPSLRGLVKVEAHFKGWPKDASTLDDADTIFLTSDGSDRREADHPLYIDDRIKVLERQMKRGCGLVFFHWSTFNPTRFHDQITDWVGGYFDYETGPAPRKWYSTIQTWDAASTLGRPTHPISRGVKPFAAQEEYYYRLRFRENDPRLKPIVVTRPPNEPKDFTVGWAVERTDGGRGFGFTGGHFYQNWWNPDFRKLVLNAIVWTAKIEVPEGGVASEPFDRFKALIVAGHNHPAHDWRATTAALITALEQDPRAIVHVTENVEDLANVPLDPSQRSSVANEAKPRVAAPYVSGYNIFDYDLVVLNYNNWDKPGLSEAAKKNFARYIQSGRGLAAIHFANGAFNLTLPDKESDWPEFRTNLVRRVWMAGNNRSGHDSYGEFRVAISKVNHPITSGLPSFDTIDELYFRQEGELPIEPLATAKSKVTGNDEPMAWAYNYGQGRVFQTVLGHADVSIRKAAALIRRGCVWAARRDRLSFDPPIELLDGVLFREGSFWTPEQSRKRAESSSQRESRSGFAFGNFQPLENAENKIQNSKLKPAAKGSFAISAPVSQPPIFKTRQTGKSLATGSVSPKKILPPNVGLDQGGKYGHWGNEGEDDWVDDRWNKMDPGLFLCSSLQTATGVALKSIAISIGENRDAGVCFDSGQINFREGWISGFIRKSPKRFGIIEMPRIKGRTVFTSWDGPAWGDAPTRYRGLFVHGPRVVLSYDVGGVPVLDAPWLASSGDLRVFTRAIEIGPTTTQRELNLAASRFGEFKITSNVDSIEATAELGQDTILVRVNGPEVELIRPSPDHVAIRFPASHQVRRAKIAIGTCRKSQFAAMASLAYRALKREDLSELAKPGPPHSSEKIVTRGSIGQGPGPFVIDTLTLPYDNPYHSLMFVSGHDFFSNGDAAICTLHGDVWRVSGIDDRLEKLTWQRIASGLFQPLGLRIVDDRVYVIGRDQITRLQDLNGDAETDFYENFHNAIQTSEGGHDFVTCLESDAIGNFYYVDPFGLHRVSKNGTATETLATGWRNPNGLSVSPHGVVTVSPQEGEWTPASQIAEAKSGGYYGFGGPKVTKDRPLGYDPPLCWIPRYLDNSSGGEVWVPHDRWGALAGQLLHLSYGRCQMMLVLRDVVDGQAQGAIVPLKGRFLSGIMRGRFRTQDGNLYLSGLKGWVTSALRDGCLQRVRYTGDKLSLPIAFHAHSNGLLITFSEQLDRTLATDAESYGMEQWNYHYASDYGSKEFSARNPDTEGHDPVELHRATLLNDGRSVFLEIPDLKPVMQFQVQYNLEDKEGAPVRGKLIATINRTSSAFHPTN